MRVLSAKQFTTSPNACPSCGTHIGSSESCGRCSFSLEACQQLAAEELKPLLSAPLGYFTDARSQPLPNEQARKIEERIRAEIKKRFPAHPAIIVFFDWEGASLSITEKAFALMNLAHFDPEIDPRKSVLFTFGVSEEEVEATATPGYRIEPFLPHEELSELLLGVLPQDPRPEEIVDFGRLMESYGEVLKQRSEIAMKAQKESKR